MNIDLEKTIKKHGGKWVVIDDAQGKVVISGKEAMVVYNKAKKKGYKTPHLFKVPSRLIAYIGQLHDLQV